MFVLALLCYLSKWYMDDALLVTNMNTINNFFK